MNRFMTYDQLRKYAYVNDQVCKKDVRGIALRFFGLGNTSMYSADIIEGEYYGERGILYVIPYTNPWSWMNRQAAAYTDEILDVLFEKYELEETVPIVSTGGSMGGLSALVYPVYTKRTPSAVVANCPACDIFYEYFERKDRPDLARTLCSAVWNEEGDLETALKTISPFHLLDRMPDIPYHIFHCDEDRSLNIDRHSSALVPEMRKRGLNVTYYIQHISAYFTAI